jgi:alpha-L-rhamnosidase
MASMATLPHPPLLLPLLVFIAAASAASASSSPSPSHSPADPVAASLQSAFLWCPTAPAGAQAYVAFRGSFPALPVPPSPASNPALLHLFADARYMVFLDGAYIARGPGRFNPSSPEYVTIDLTAALANASSSPSSSSPHTLAVLVHTYGSSAINGRLMYHAPGLTARLDVGPTTVLSTNQTWRCSASTEYLPSPVAWSSIPDVIDARVADYRAWSGAAFNDSAWAQSVPVNGSTWGDLVARALPMPEETPIPFTSITVLPGNQPLALPLTLAAGQSVVLNVSRMAMVYAALDLTSPADGSVLTLNFALRYVNGAPAEEYGVGSTFTARAGPSNALLAGDTWVSHYLTVACTSGNVTLTSFSLTERAYPFRQLGSFNAGDPLLPTLWTRAVATLRAVTDDAYGSDARERNEWLQDPAQPNFITTSVAFTAADLAAAAAGGGGEGGGISDARLLRLLLRHAALAQLPDGRIRATFPTDRGPSDCHYVIEDYSMQWVEALRWYFDATGDADFVAWAWPTLALQMEWFAARVNATTGLLLAREYTSFDDPLAYNTAEGTALNSFYYKSLVDSAYLAGTALGDATNAALFAANATAVAAAINSQLWNATEGTYNAGLLAGSPFYPSAHAAMLALQRGVVPDARLNSTRAFFLSTYQNPGGFHVCSNPDAEAMIAERAGVNMTVSHYWALEVLYALDTAEGDAEALGRVRAMWGDMVATGGDAGTLWETFADSESCHNYGAVPAWFLSSRVLGVRAGPLGAPPAGLPAPRTLTLEPHLGDLLWADGTVVTPVGAASVLWSRAGDDPLSLVFSAELPAGLDALLVRIPDGNATTLLLDGAPAPGAAQVGRYAVAALTPTGEAGQVVEGQVRMLAAPPPPAAPRPGRRGES